MCSFSAYVFLSPGAAYAKYNSGSLAVFTGWTTHGVLNLGQHPEQFGSFQISLLQVHVVVRGPGVLLRHHCALEPTTVPGKGHQRLEYKGESWAECVSWSSWHVVRA